MTKHIPVFVHDPSPITGPSVTLRVLASYSKHSLPSPHLHTGLYLPVSLLPQCQALNSFFLLSTRGRPKSMTVRAPPTSKPLPPTAVVDPELEGFLVETFLFQSGISFAQIKAQLTAFSYQKASVSTDQFGFPFLAA